MAATATILPPPGNRKGAPTFARKKPAAPPQAEPLTQSPASRHCTLRYLKTGRYFPYVQFVLATFLAILLANPSCLCGGLFGHARHGAPAHCHGNAEVEEAAYSHCHHAESCTSPQAQEDSHPAHDGNSPWNSHDGNCPCLADHSDARTSVSADLSLPVPRPSSSEATPVAGARGPSADLRSRYAVTEKHLLSACPNRLLRVYCVLRV